MRLSRIPTALASRKVAAMLMVGGVAAPAMAQGTLHFSTLVTAGLDARVYLGIPYTFSSPAPGSYVGQLYGGTSPDSLSRLATAVAFRDAPEAGRGYITDGVVAVPGVLPGAMAWVQLRAWRSDLGSSFEVAELTGGGLYVGESNRFQIELGGEGVGPPAVMVGLQGFWIPIPEPSAPALLIVGFSSMLLYSSRFGQGRVSNPFAKVSEQREKMGAQPSTAANAG